MNLTPAEELQQERVIIAGLWNEHVSCDTYGSKELYYEHLFEQYRIFVEAADRVSARRNLTNTFFLTLNTLLVGVVGVFYEKVQLFSYRWALLIPLIACLTMCIVWWRLLRSYRQLNHVKFKVIGEYERRLPTSPYWQAEWPALGEGQKPRSYTPLTQVEYWVPIVFGLMYIFLYVVLFFV